MPAKKPYARRSLALTLSAALVCNLVGAPARAMGAGDGDGGSALTTTQRTDAQVDELVSSMLAAGDYVEGEAIVCCLDGEDGLVAQSDGPLAQAERLSAVTARQYAEATGETLPAAQEQGFLTAQAQDEEVRILKVCDYSRSTQELLRALLEDPQVLSAEPNYLMDFAGYDGQDLADASDDAPTEGQDSKAESDQDPAETDAQLVADAVIQDSTGAVDQDSPEASGPELTGANDQDLADAATADLGNQSVPLTVQANGTAAGGQTDLTGYQWFSVGVNAAIPQYPDASNPGIHVPGWNDPSATNASGVVALLDSGVDYTHPDLEGAVYRFSPQLQAQLGCGEYGYAPAREDPTDPMDGYGHGTHCAGIMAARWNGFGVSGVANGAKVMAIAISQSMTNSDFSYDSIIKGYDFILRAAKAGVDIRSVNRSLASDPICNANAAMIKAAGELGIVTCYATGNFVHDHDVSHDETNANQLSPYVLRVNAADTQDSKARFSDYGRYTTDLFSPGTAILSTIPTTDNNHTSRRYFVEADEDPLYLKTDFSDSLLDVPSDDSFKPNSVSAGDIGYNGDGSSLKVNQSTEAESGSATVILDIPVGNLIKDDIQDISFAFSAGDFELYNPSAEILLSDDEFSSSAQGIESVCDSASGGWTIMRLRLQPNQMEQDLKYVTDSKGNRCVRVKASGMLNSKRHKQDEPVDLDVYVDQVAIGGPNNTGVIPYRYMDGTSMATPVVTACAAVVSSQIEEDDLAERAAKTVRMLKGAVRQAEGYQGLCKQNGEIDLSLLGDDDACVPVLESAQVTGDELVLEGAYFSDAGTLTVGGQQARVVSWSEGTIVAEWPQGVTSGLIPISVKTAAGVQTCRAFALLAPDSVGGADLYERGLGTLTLKAGGESIMGELQSMVMTRSGSLFVAVANGDDREEATVHHLLRSDDKGITYKGIELPQELGRVKLVAADDVLYVFGAVMEHNTSIENWRLYRMDVATESLELLGVYTKAKDQVGDENSLVYLQGRLYLVDSQTTETDEGGFVLRQRIKCFDDDFAGLHGEFLLNRVYGNTSFSGGPKVAVVDNSIYVCGIGTLMGEAPVVSDFVGLERVDVAADGTMSCTDLSDALAGLDERIVSEGQCMTASDEGIFLIGRGLDGLLPEGAACTDTFFLRHGTSVFEPYEKTLSYAPVENPIATFADGWLYAYGVSNYEEWPMFGRATWVGQKPQPTPGPEPTPTPTPAPTPASQSTTRTASTTTSKRLAKTGEGTTFAVLAGAAVAGALSLSLGLQRRRRLRG